MSEKSLVQETIFLCEVCQRSVAQPLFVKASDCSLVFLQSRSHGFRTTSADRLTLCAACHCQAQSTSESRSKDDAQDIICLTSGPKAVSPTNCRSCGIQPENGSVLGSTCSKCSASSEHCVTAQPAQFNARTSPSHRLLAEESMVWNLLCLVFCLVFSWQPGHT